MQKSILRVSEHGNIRFILSSLRLKLPLDFGDRKYGHLYVGGTFGA